MVRGFASEPVEWNFFDRRRLRINLDDELKTLEVTELSDRSETSAKEAHPLLHEAKNFVLEFLQPEATRPSARSAFESPFIADGVVRFAEYLRDSKTSVADRAVIADLLRAVAAMGGALGTHPVMRQYSSEVKAGIKSSTRKASIALLGLRA